MSYCLGDLSAQFLMVASVCAFLALYWSGGISICRKALSIVKREHMHFFTLVFFLFKSQKNKNSCFLLRYLILYIQDHFDAEGTVHLEKVLSSIIAGF